MHGKFKEMVEGHVRNIEEYIFKGKFGELLGLALNKDREDGFEPKFGEIKNAVMTMCYDKDPTVKEKARAIAKAAYPEAYADLKRKEQTRTTKFDFEEDGMIQAGEVSKRRFRERLPVIRENNITDSYRERIRFILERYLAQANISPAHKSNLQKILNRIRQGKYKIYGFHSIVINAENDYLLGLNNAKRGELFIATDLLAELESRSPHLANEYFLHELLCKELRHKRAIFSQQKMFPGNYPDKRKLSEQTPEDPYKGLMGETRRRTAGKSDSRCFAHG
jgi:hypothetical protein